MKSAPTLEAIRDYRERVQAFIRHVVDHMLEVEETTSGVNPRAEETVHADPRDRREARDPRGLGAAQREQLGILAQVDEINGMLVDLVS